MAKKQQRFSFRKFQLRWQGEKGKLAVQIARRAENQFKENFRLGGFLDKYLDKWEPRKKADPGRAILVKSGRLKRGVRSLPIVGGTNLQRIDIANEVPYARYHNEGVGRMPQRKFMGASAELNNRIRKAIKHTLNRIFQ